jgi:hypothetical protein
MITNDARCTRKIKFRIVIAKAHSTRRKLFFPRQLDLNIKNKLVKCYIWSIALCGAETWSLWKLDRNNLKALKCGAEEGWRRSVGPIV